MRSLVWLLPYGEVQKSGYQVFGIIVGRSGISFARPESARASRVISGNRTEGFRQNGRKLAKNKLFSQIITNVSTSLNSRTTPFINHEIPKTCLFPRALICASILALTAAQSFALSWAQSYGVGSYDGNGQVYDDPFYGSGFDFPVAMAKMPDGGFVVAGQIDLPKYYSTYTAHTSGRSMSALVRFGVDGTVLWQYALRQTNDTTQGGIFYPGTSHISQIATDAQGNVFICGNKGGNGITNNTIVPFVAKFSPDGALLWDNGFSKITGTIGDPAQPYEVGVGPINYMGLTNDGGVIVTTSQARPNVGYSIPSFAKFNSDGSLAFYKTYNNPAQYLGTSPVCQSKDGSRYVAAMRYTDYGCLLLVTDSAGNLIAQRGYAPDNSNETPVTIIATADGGFATLSAINDYGGGIIRKFNADLSAEVFEKRIAAASGHNPHVATNSLIETADGGFLISGETYNGPSTYDVMLMKLASDATLQFVSLLGGPLNEGGPVSTGPSTAFAIPLTNGGYGLATTSASYNTGGAIGGGYYYKPDWWIAKTDANRHVRNFNGTMLDESLSSYNLTGSPQSAANLSDFVPPNYSYGAVMTNQPAFIFEDLGTDTPPNQPQLVIQAAGPRIISNHTAEAIVEQHFTYQIFTAFFPGTSPVTYSADGLPQNFTIDAQSGIISGIAHTGSETVENNLPPIPIVLHATDGIDTADLTLELAISDGPPTLTVDVHNNVLTFVAKQTGKLAGRVMRVQATTTPGNESSWQQLANGTDGFMPYDIDSSSYILASTDYPQGNGVYFRARLRSPAHGEVFSNVVGPFDLNPGKIRIGKTQLYITRNGLVSNIRFGATEENVPSGIAVRIQTTKTPASEGSWTDVSNGAMGQDSNAPKEFYLGFDDYASGTGNYFRAIAKVPNSNYLDSISAPQGPFTFIYDPAATVTVTVPHNGSGDGTDYDLPIQPISSSFNVTADAQSARALKRLSLIYDGDIIQSFDGANHGLTNYTTNVVGDHLIEATAIDDLGIVGYAKPVHLRVAPAAPGKIYYIAQEGNWSDSSIWSDSQGNHGVPGANDFAVLGSVNVHLTQATQVKALSLNGGTIDGAKLTVIGFCTIGGGRIANDVDIADGATLLFINDADVGLGGTVTNFGRAKIHGKGGITMIPSGNTSAARGRLNNPNGIGNLFGRFVNWVKTTFHPPAGGRQGSKTAAAPTPTPGPVLTAAPEVRHVTLESVLNKGKVEVKTDADGLITNDGGSLITNDGGSLIGNDGAGLVDRNGNPIVAQGGGNIVAQGGGNIVAQGGGNIVAQGGGNIVAQGGGNIVAQGGGNIVATGGGNIVAQGGGNIISTNGGGLTGGRPSLPNRGAVQPPSNYQQDEGETDLNGLTIIGSIALNGGKIDGSGTVIGDVENSGAIVAPGHSAGALAITGNFTQGSNGAMVLEAAGGLPRQFDQMQVGTHATLGGTLQFHTLDGYVPLPADPFNPLGYGSADGGFDYASSNGQVTVTENGVALVLQPTATNPLTLTAAVSRKVHGAAGPFDVLLPLTGQLGVECRSSNGQHTLIFFFSNNITSAGASLNSDTGNANGAPIISANTVTVNLSGIGNGKQISVTLNGVMDEFGQFLPDVTVPMGTLIGDTSGNGTVTGTDVSQTKLQSGAAVTNSNFREDVTVSGGINGTDVSIVKARSGTGISGQSLGNSVSAPPAKIEAAWFLDLDR